MTLSDLPGLNACMNGLASMFLLLGYFFIKKGDQSKHRVSMFAALLASACFLSGYLTYHIGMQRAHGTAHTRFLEPAWFRPIYLTILFTHLAGAIAIVPLIFVTVRRALKGQFETHRAIARVTWPVWMYVSITGVAIYFILYRVFPQK